MTGNLPIKGVGPAGRQRPSLQASFPTLEPGHLHEIHNGFEDRAAAMAFALAQGRMQGQAARSGVIFALRTPRRMRVPTIFSGDGLALLGIDPGRLTIVETRDEVEMLRAGLEAARCPGVATLLIESEGRFADYDLTASRRLVLAAEASGVTILLLRGDAEPRSSGAQTRWMIRSGPSTPLEADAPGLPVVEAQLLRCRGGSAGGRWRLAWDVEHGCFRDADKRDGVRTEAMPGTVVPFSRLRTDADDDGAECRDVA